VVTRAGERKGHEAQKSRPEPEVMVRLAKVVPTIEQQAQDRAKDAELHDNGLPCSGRCGHCDYHPCRLHAPI
jgi:hypothetical protein